MKKEEFFDQINKKFYNSQNVVPDSVESLEMVELIRECFYKLEKVPPVSLQNLLFNICDVDHCIDCVSDVFCIEGLDSTDEPNEYGLRLESAIDFLLHFRYVLEDYSEPNPIPKVSKLRLRDRLFPKR